MEITNTLYQSPNTIVFEGSPKYGFKGYYREIVIAEKWGYRVVWCMTKFDDGSIKTHLYRLEVMRKLSEEDKKLVGPYVAYGLYDVWSNRNYGINGIFYNKQEAMFHFQEKVKIREHTSIAENEVDSRLEKELEMSGIHCFIGDYYYCPSCALHFLFADCKYYMLRSLQTQSFQDIEGYAYDLIHEDSIQYESFPDEYFKDGLYCHNKECKAEIFAPIEEYEDDEVLDEDELVTGFIAGDTVDNSDYEQSIPNDFDSFM